MEWRWREGSQAGRSIGPDEPEYLTKSDKLFDGDPGFAKNGAERPHTKGFVVWNRNTGKRRFAAQDYVASTLALKDKSNSRQDSNEFLTREVRRQLGHRVEVFSSMNSLWSSTGSGSPVA